MTHSYNKDVLFAYCSLSSLEIILSPMAMKNPCLKWSYEVTMK